MIDAAKLSDCLHTLVQVWYDNRYGPSPQPLRPNIILILSDDQRWDTTDSKHSPFGTDIMPSLRAELGGAGLELNEAFMTTPLCCPSRSSILRGQYATQQAFMEMLRQMVVQFHLMILLRSEHGCKRAAITPCFWGSI